MTIQQWLQTTSKALDSAGVPTARLDCLVLLEDVTGMSRSKLLAESDQLLSAEQLEQLFAATELRAKHIPLAYIRGKTEFYGREFMINSAVLEPRPESEAMIDILRSLNISSPSVVDVGTGSGALGITAALEIPDSRVTLVDIDESAMAVAIQNCARFEQDLPCIIDDLLSHAARRGVRDIDVVLANLPYVPDDYQINTAALHEPKIAIFGGFDGLDLYRRLFAECREIGVKHILTESLPFQHQELGAIATLHGYTESEGQDFIQLFVPRT